MWKACLLWGILPPGIKASWDDNGADQQADLLAFAQIYEHDQSDWQATLAGAELKGSKTERREPSMERPKQTFKPKKRRK